MSENQVFDMPAYRAAAPELDQAERLTLLDAAATTIEAHYAHLPQKRKTRAVDPVALLRNLASALPAPSTLDFHAELSALFAALHDLHTFYVLPPYFAAAVAFLPFTAARIGPNGDHILVSHVLPGFDDAHFHAGVELVSWNGRPILEELAVQEAISGGANPAAARARALQMLTQRPLLRTPPPEAAQIVIGFRTAHAPTPRQITLDWRISTPAAAPPPIAHPTALRSSLDAEGDALHRHRRHHYGHHTGRVHGEAVSATHPYRQEIPSPQPDVHAWVGEAGGRRFGVLRIQSFKVNDADAFIADIQALLAQLPQDGLVIDVRDNPGGLVEAAERLLQCFSNAAIRPVNVAFLATQANLALCQANTPGEGRQPPLDLSDWVAPLQQALAQNDTWSAALPMTAPGYFAAGQRAYPGPVVLLTSGCCYSACDIFIAGFHDNALGTILGIDSNIGAGGANMWKRSQIQLLRTGTAEPLPGDADLHVAVRRVFRADPAATPLEELGIPIEHIHHRTRHDVLDQDVDLFTKAVALLPGTR